MKTKVTKNSIYKYFGKNRVVCFGYCKIQAIENYLPELSKSSHYTTGIYGWNADIYCIEGGSKFFAICTGYRPFGVYDEKLSNIADEYEKKCHAAGCNDKEKVVSEFLDALEDYLQERETNNYLNGK